MSTDTKRRRVVVLGGGGHARVCVDLLRQDPELEVVGIVGGGPGPLDGVPFLGGDDALPHLRDEGIRCAFVAVGDNRRRLELMTMCGELGFEFVNARSPTAVVSRFAAVGVGVALMPGAIVNAGSVIGSGCIINTNAGVDHDCVLADVVHVAPGSTIAGNVVIGTGAFLGAGTVVIPTRRIGEWATTGAGAVVIHDIPSGSTAIGVPAVSRSTAGE